MAEKRHTKSQTRHPELKRAKITQAMEMITKGLPQKDTAYLMGVTPRTVRNWQNIAQETGIIAEIRDRMRNESLPKSLDVVNTILNADVQEMTDKRTVKAHELKLKAAKHMMDVTGVKEDVRVRVTQRMDLDSYAELRAARHIMAPKRELASKVEEGGVTSVTPTTGELSLTPTGHQREDNYATDWEQGLPAESAEIQSEPASGFFLRKVTIDGIDGKSWEGETEQAAISAARRGAEKTFKDREQTHEPEWMQKERDLAKEMRERDNDDAQAYLGYLAEPTNE